MNIRDVVAIVYGISLGKRSVIYYLSKKYFCQVPILIYDKKKSAWLSQKDILMQWQTMGKRVFMLD